ncbi:Similar to Lactose permease; acc. no. P07921 [Pyronema omphalodes CBS 100304]|uniref:Similar to Lactose permease acc. no. P07921 n=1 Tax=Pyronema omphalodes (strain CBS 100304) TaxID=1076935 RepID=U4LLZ5_PYROM|nr:Similar to Lactose permease; acc. no. P07921 [Pyronema omphalodes CBS 100304]
MASSLDPNTHRFVDLVAADHTPWYRKPNLTRLYIFLIPAAMGVEWTSGFDGSIMNGLQAVQTWDNYFHQPRGAILGIMNSIYSLGALSMMIFVPWVNDRYGRKASIVVGNIIMVLGAVLQTASVNLGMFLAARFMLGMGIPFALSGGSQLIGELAYQKERPSLTSAFNVSWYIGGIIAAGVTLGTFQIQSDWAWRIPSLLQLLPSGITLIFIWGLPESPRWLISQDRSEEAWEILVKYHGEGDPNSPIVRTEYAEMKATMALDLESKNRTWLELVSTQANLKRCALVAFIGVFSQWSGNGLVSYYLSRVLETVGIKNKRTQNKINLSLNCWNLITGMTASWLVTYTPRRTMYLVSVTGMLITFASWTGASASYAETGSSAAAGAVVGMIFLYYPFYNGAPLTYTYTIEVFPFSMRAKGTVVVQTFSRFASFFNQFVNPIGLENIGWKYYIVYTIWLAVEALGMYTRASIIIAYPTPSW